MLTNNRRLFSLLTKLVPTSTRSIPLSTITRPFTSHLQYLCSTHKPETREFKTETKKLLDIVAKSLYTDS